jgi:hypothetical protein
LNRVHVLFGEAKAKAKEVQVYMLIILSRRHMD